MIDNRIHYREPLVGSGHPYLPDTLNRLALVEANQDGHGRVRYLAAQRQPPPTGPDEVALYCRPVFGRLELFMRREANGAEVPLTGEGGGSGPAEARACFPAHRRTGPDEPPDDGPFRRAGYPAGNC